MLELGKDIKSYYYYISDFKKVKQTHERYLKKKTQIKL